jgi:hypothetical protein
MADDTLSVRKGTLGALGMRYHELALQRWFYSTFFVRSGYPVPVVFSTPMDAFGNFKQLWKADKSPFTYLFDLKDDKGTPLYEPYPSTLRYPLISVFRRGWKYRPEQSYGLHQFRHMNWPTVDRDVGRCELGNVTVSYRPNAWDYRFQVDHFCMRPDTQAYFIEQLMRTFVVGGGTAQTWMQIHYPVLGMQKIRMYIDGEIENSTKEEPEDQSNMEFRTSFTVMVEGYTIDQEVEFVPALWSLLLRSANQSSSPGELVAAFDEQVRVDLRLDDANVTLNSRDNVPSDEECQRELKTTGTYPPSSIYFSGSDQPDAYTKFGFSSTNTTDPFFLGGNSSVIRFRPDNRR